MSLSGANPRNALPPWPILVVDDDPHVHDMSRVLLRDFEFQGRAFSLISAFSAAEALPLLAAHPDVPLVLLDVVMEHEQAGLDLVRRIRLDLDNQRIRIILRTGYPGQAPERQVMLDYDINDYRAKSELTSDQLFTAMVGALRSWSHIDTIERMNHALEKRVAERTLELASARALAEHLLDHVPAPMWVRDGDGTLVQANRAFHAFFGPGLALPTALQGPVSLSLEQEMQIPSPESGTRTILLRQTPLPDLPATGLNAVPPPRCSGGCIGLLTDISDRKQMEAELRHLAVTDSLTGCFNRRHFFQRLEQAWDNPPENAGPLSVLLLDVDHFKRVNDRHGHLVGDQVLRCLVRIIGSVLPQTALLARFGGEEFAVLAPLNLEAAEQLAESVRQAIAADPLPLSPTRLPVTVSIGVAQCADSGDHPDSLLARADAALYRAKGGGRNCVVSLRE